VTPGTLARLTAIQSVLIFYAKFPKARPLPCGNQFAGNYSIPVLILSDDFNQFIHKEDRHQILYATKQAFKIAVALQ